MAVDGISAGSLGSRRRVWVWSLASAILVLCVALLPWLWHASGGDRHSLAIVQIARIAAAPAGLPRYPEANEPVQRLGALSIAELRPAQVFLTFRTKRPADGPLALLAPRTDGQVNLFVNGVALSAEAPGRPLFPGVLAHRFWIIPQHYLRPGVNRIDLLVGGSGLRPFAGAIHLAPAAALEPIAHASAALIETGRSGLLVLSALALVANLLAAALRARIVHLPIAACVAAIGAWGLLGNAPALFDTFTVLIEQLLVTAAMLAVAMIVRVRAEAAITVERRAQALLLLACAACALASAVGAAMDMSLAPAAGVAMLVASALYLGLTLARHPMQDGLEPRADRVLAGAAILGVGGLAATLAIANAAGLQVTNPPFTAELALLLSLILLAGVAAGIGVTVTAQRLHRMARHRLDQAQVIRQQRARLDATQLALNRVSRESAVLEERQRLARDVHDGIGGQLASLIAQVRLRRVDMEDVERALSGGLSELRLLVDSLDMVGGTLGDTLSALRVRLRDQTAAGGMQLEWYQALDLDIAVRDPRWVLNLYRIIQEAVSNAVRHSGGDHISVHIERPDPATLSIRVKDNGSAFPATVPTGGHGLANMAHRAGEANGTLRIAPGADGGAEVLVDLPIPL